ncbi:unnamed protein product, partial [Rotaria magnacalcarata]
MNRFFFYSLTNFLLERELVFNFINVLIASVIIVFFLILVGLCIFNVIRNLKRQRHINHNIVTSSIKKSSIQHPIVIEPIH